MSAPRRPRIYFECTHTYHSDLNTGIQRATRNMVRYAPEAAAPRGYDVLPVIVEDGVYKIVDAANILADKQRLAPAPPIAPESAAPLPRKKKKKKTLLQRLGFKKRTPPPTPEQPPPPPEAEDLDARSGDVLLLLDSSWTIPLWPATDRFKARGGHVYGFVYDLIPITHSHTSDPPLVVVFKEWAARIMATVDGFIGISKFTCSQIHDYAQEHGYTKWTGPGARITHNHLGSELDLKPTSNEAPARAKAILGDSDNLFLMVSTIEPRKKQDIALDAFDELLRSGGDAKLLIIGRQAWKMDHLLERIATHPELNKRLFLLRDAADEEVEYFYDHAAALLMPSEVEGFGLPVVESRQRGLPIICSDIPVFREIAGPNAHFFQPDNVAELAQLMQHFLDHDRVPPEMRVRSNAEWLTWRESAANLVEKLLAFEHEMRPVEQSA